MGTTPTEKKSDNGEPLVCCAPPAEDIDPRVARSRAKIVDAARDILIESGQRSVTVDAVCERSGVAKSTLYRHWSSRTELLVDVMRACMPAGPTELPDGPFEETLCLLLRQVADSVAAPEWKRVFPAILSLKLTLPEVSEMAQADTDEKHQLIQALLDLGAAEGALAPGLDPDDVAPLLLGPIIFSIVADDVPDSHELADRVARTFIAAHRP